MVIYEIYSKSADKYYIGSTVRYKKRKNQHINALKNNRHHNYILQNIFNKYGLEDLTFKIIEEVDCHDRLIEREEYHINEYNSYMDGINLKEYHERKQSFKLSDGAKEKIRIALTGKKKTKEHRESLSKARKGKDNLKLRGQKRTPEQIENIRNGVLNSKKQREAWDSRKIPILQYDMCGNFVKEWGSIIEACKHFGVDNSSNLIKVLKGRGKSFRGFKWVYKVNEN